MDKDFGTMSIIS